MLRRVILYSVLAAALGAGFLVLRRPAALTPAGAAPASAGAPTGAQLLAERERKTPHLQPDTRFLDAFGDVAHVLTGAPARRADAAWQEGGWMISLGGRRVGRLSEYPRFGEARDLLVAWATTLGARESLAAAPGLVLAGLERQVAALHALHAAGLADERWAAGGHDVVTARLGARALAWLAAESFDQAGAGEAVPARALAWNAVVSAADPKALGAETALLADVFGYPAEASELGATLGRGDPVRDYVLRRDEDLDAVASRGGSPRAVRWLALRRCVQRGDLEAWQVAAERGLDDDDLLALPLLGSALALGRFESSLEASTGLLAAVSSDLRLNEISPAPIAGSDAGALGQALTTVETLFESMPESADGVFLDRDVIRGWYRGALYSALFGIGEHLRLERSDFDATKAFAIALGDGSGGEGPVAEFQRWYSHLVRLQIDSRARVELKSDLVGMEHFGAAPRLHTWYAIVRTATTHDAFVRQCAAYLVPRLDTRPELLEFWGDVRGDALFDLAAAERVWSESVRASHPRDLRQRGWWAARRGDRATLDRLLADASFRPEERVELVRAVRAAAPEDSTRLDAISESILAENPDDWALARDYVAALAARHRNPRVRAIAGAWVARPDRSQRAFDDIDARTRLARACLEEGRIDEGLEAIRPVVASWQHGAMSVGIDLLERQGRTAEAEAVAEMAWERYPDSPEAEAHLVGLWWRHGRHGKAARILARTSDHLGPAGWRVAVGRQFAAFEAERPKEAKAAVDSLIAAGLDGWSDLGALLAALEDAGRPASAAPWLDRIRTRGWSDVSQLVGQYRNVKAARGTDAAGAWLREHARDPDPRRLGLLALAAVGEKEGEITWALPLPPEGTGLREAAWLARLVVALRDSIGTPEQRAQLDAWFARPAADMERHYGRMLLGLESSDAVLALPFDNRTESEACYYIGLRRQIEGDVTDAARWYARCADLNVRSNAEHFWAIDQLVAWSSRGRSLERLSAEARRTARNAAAPAA